MQIDLAKIVFNGIVNCIVSFFVYTLMIIIFKIKILNV